MLTVLGTSERKKWRPRIVTSTASSTAAWVGNYYTSWCPNYQYYEERSRTKRALHNPTAAAATVLLGAHAFRVRLMRKIGRNLLLVGIWEVYTQVLRRYIPVYSWRYVAQKNHGIRTFFWLPPKIFLSRFLFWRCYRTSEYRECTVTTAVAFDSILGWLRNRCFQTCNDSLTSLETYVYTPRRTRDRKLSLHRWVLCFISISASFIFLFS